MAAFLASRIQLFSASVSLVLVKNRPFSVHVLLSGGQKWRISNGMANDGLAYGPLTDLPDWSFVDGQPAPETKSRRKRKNRRLTESERIMRLLNEMDNGVKEENPYKGIAER